MAETNKRNCLQFLQKFGKLDILTMLLTLVIEVILFSVLSPYFFRLNNILTLIQYCSVIGIVALPFSLLLISGSFDMSMGSQVAFTSMIAALVFRGLGGGTMALIASIISAIIAGAICGWVNAFFILKVKLIPFLATMCSMQYLRGFCYLFTNGQSLAILEKNFAVLGRGRSLGIPNTLWIYIVLIVIFGFVAKYTVFGRRCYIIGGNRDAARLMGVNAEKHVTIIHIITSAMVGFVGFLTASQVGAAIPSSSAEYGFDVISGAVLGGVSMAGGKGSPLYSVLGVIILAVLDNGLVVLNVSSYWQLVFSALILLVAVTIDSVRNIQAAKKY